MKRIAILGVVVAVVLVGAYAVLTVYDANLKVGRMWETPAVKPHENPIPVMTAGVVPFHGGEAQLRAMGDNEMKSPLDLADAKTIDSGKQGYIKFCIQCHGKYHDGNGTVGQSFQPLPGDIRSAKAQAKKPGELFSEISYGVPGGRQPALATTIDKTTRWQIIAYVKSLGTRK